MLKEFRSIDVYWDKATRRIYEEIRSSSSDEKGRKLTVQIVNDGQIQDLTNVALNLYWETQDGENRGLDPFEPLDTENGIYELYFRTGMLKHVGKLNAHLHLVDTTGALTSEPFTIVVFEGVDVDAIESDDSFSALTQALVEVQTFKEGYSLLDGRITAVDAGLLKRLKKAGDSMSGNIEMNNNKITGLGNATANSDALNLQTADSKYLGKDETAKNSEKLANMSPTQLSTPVTIPMRGVNGNFYVGEPTVGSHCATKKYVDEKTPSGDLPDGTNLNNVENGIWAIYSSRTYTNMPSGLTTGVLFVMPTNSGAYLAQIFIGATGIRTRVRTGALPGTWSAWS